jgi:hypothetical protein
MLIIHQYSLNAGFNGFYPLESGNDDRLYWEIAQEILSGKVRPDNPNSFGYFLAYLFRFTGSNLLVGKILSVLAGSASVSVGIILLRELLHPMKDRQLLQGWQNPMNWLGAVLAVYPSQLFYSTQLIRDSLIQFFGLFTLLMILRIIRTRAFSAIFLALIAFWLLYGLRPYLTLSIAAATGIYLLLYWRVKLQIKTVMLLFVGVTFAFAPLMLGLGVFGSSYISRLSNTKTLTTFRQEAYSTGGSSVGIQIDYSNPVSFLLTFPMSFLTAMFGPFLWQVRSAVQAIALPEAMFMLFLIPYLRNPFRNTGLSTLVFLVAITSLVVVAVYSDNIGANTRLRLLPWSMIFIYVAAQRQFVYEKRQIRKHLYPLLNDSQKSIKVIS